MEELPSASCPNLWKEQLVPAPNDGMIAAGSIKASVAPDESSCLSAPEWFTMYYARV